MTNYKRMQLLLEPWQQEQIARLQDGKHSISRVIRLILNQFFIENGNAKLPPDINEREESYIARKQVESTRKRK